MVRLSVAVGGLALVLGAWHSAFRTAVTPGRYPNILMGATFRCVAESWLFLARAVPRSVATPLLGLCAPAVLLGLAACWLAMSIGGFGLLAWSGYGVPLRPSGLSPWFTGRSGLTPLVLSAWLSAAGLGTALTVHCLRFRAAYHRREALVATLAVQFPRTCDAETVLDRWLAVSSRDDLDHEFERWAVWFGDVAVSQAGHPALVFVRPSSRMCWVDAGCTVLDVAALVRAMAPRWAKPGSQAVLDAGIPCLQQVTGSLGIVMVPRSVSLHGREEREFAETVRSALESGLPPQQDLPEVWRAFQRARIQYAPHAAAIGTELCFDFVSWPPHD